MLKERIFTSVSRSEASTLLRKIRKEVKVSLPGQKWNDKKEEMILHLSRDAVLTMQSKVEMYPSNLARQVSNNEMMSTIFKVFPRKEKEDFEEGKCKECGSKIFWVTDRSTRENKRIPLESKTRNGYTKNIDGKAHKVTERVYISHLDICKPSRIVS